MVFLILSGCSDGDGSPGATCLCDSTESASEAVDLSLDVDGDGLSAADEESCGSKNDDPDSDNDGLNDLEECKEFLTNANQSDTDGDGRTDFDEVKSAVLSNPREADVDCDQRNDAEEVSDGTDPNAAQAYVYLADSDPLNSDPDNNECTFTLDKDSFHQIDIADSRVISSDGVCALRQVEVKGIAQGSDSYISLYDGDTLDSAYFWGADKLGFVAQAVLFNNISSGTQNGKLLSGSDHLRLYSSYSGQSWSSKLCYIKLYFDRIR